MLCCHFFDNSAFLYCCFFKVLIKNKYTNRIDVVYYKITITLKNPTTVFKYCVIYF